MHFSQATPVERRKRTKDLAHGDALSAALEDTLYGLDSTGQVSSVAPRLVLGAALVDVSRLARRALSTRSERITRCPASRAVGLGLRDCARPRA